MEKRNKKYHIHFVCRGNIYRSRLAEASAVALSNPLVTVSSSGIDANDQPVRGLADPAKYVGELASISNYFSLDKTQTTNGLLDEADVIVFMNTSIYNDAVKRYTVNPHKCVVWRVGDIGEGVTDVAAINEKAVGTYEHIKTKVCKLVDEVTSVSWADVVSDTNEELGFRLPTSWVASKGLWRRGCHIILLTPSGQYVVEKRSSNIIFAPNHLDISLGGGVDSGELPEVAAIREVHEELGLVLHPNRLKLIDIHKENTYHRRYRKYSRVFISTYYALLDTDEPHIIPQKSEVADVRLLSYRQIRALLRRHRVLGFGELSTQYVYFRRVVKLTQQAWESR